MREMYSRRRMDQASQPPGATAAQPAHQGAWRVVHSVRVCFGPGSMGIGLHASDATCFSAIVVDFPRINGRPGAAELYNQRFAAEPDKCVRPGMYLAYIEEKSLENLPYNVVCSWLRAATRPVTLTFLALEPEESAEPLSPPPGPIARAEEEGHRGAGSASEDGGVWERRFEAVQAELTSQAGEWEKRENELMQQADEAKARQEQLASELQMQRELYESKLYALAGKYQRLKTAFTAVRDEAARNQQQCDKLTDQLRRMREVGVGRQRKSSVVVGLVASKRGSVTTLPKNRQLSSVEEGEEEEEGEGKEGPDAGEGEGSCEEAGKQLEGGVEGDGLVNGGEDGDAAPASSDAGEADRGHDGEEDTADAPEPQDPADENAVEVHHEEEEEEEEEEDVEALRARVSELEAQLASALESMEAMAQQQTVSARRTSMRATRAVADADDDWEGGDDGSAAEAEGRASNKEGQNQGEGEGADSERRAGGPGEEEGAQGEAQSITEDSSSEQRSPSQSESVPQEVGAEGGEGAAETGASDAGTGHGDEEQEEDEEDAPMPPPSVPPPSVAQESEGGAPEAAPATAEGEGEAEADAEESGSAQATISSLLSQLADARERAAHAEEQLANEQQRSEDLERQVFDLKQQIVRLRATSKFKDAIFERRMSTLNPALQGAGADGGSSPEGGGAPSRNGPGGAGARPAAGSPRAAPSPPKATTGAATGAAAAAAKPALGDQKRSLVYKAFGGGVRHSGWLLKTSAAKKEFIKSKRWRKRWCVVESGMLSYYESSDSQAPKGTIQLASQGVEVTQKGQAQFSISVEEGAKVYTFMSAQSSHDSMREDSTAWVEALREIVESARALGVSKTSGLSGGHLGGQGEVAASTSVLPNAGARPGATRRHRFSFDGRKRPPKL